jgi:cell shape-determining protein MreC
LILAGLLFISITGFLLPAAWTQGLISLVQVLIPFVDGAESLTDSALAAVSAESPPVAAADYLAIERHNAALEHQVVALSQRVWSLEDEVALLTATRLWQTGDDLLGAQGRLIPAKVLHRDLVSWRDSRLVRAGTLQGVRRGAPVTSAAFTVNRGTESGIRDGLAIVLGETLVGVVEQAGTHTSRVKLISDTSVQMKVRLGRIDDDGFAPHGGAYWLVGRGRGEMVLRDVPRDLVRSGEIAEGDVVLSDPSANLLPVAMVIGRISAIEPDRSNALLSIARVAAECRLDALQRVYVFDPQGDPHPAPSRADG